MKLWCKSYVTYAQDSTIAGLETNGQLALKTNFLFVNKERKFQKEVTKIGKTAKFGCDTL